MMNRKGMTLIELLVVLVVSGILIAAVYRTFISQQHTFTVQEQVVDMQQNVRLAINRMTRELRMANFGKQVYTNSDMSYNDDFFQKNGAMYGTYSGAVNPGAGGTSVTVVGAYQLKTTLSANASTGDKSIFVNDASGFDTGVHQYISINGVESHKISAIIGNEIQFPGWDKLTNDHQAGENVFLVMAITYSIGLSDGKQCLLRDDNLGSGPQPVAENIDSLQFRYVMNTGETLDVVPNNRLDDIRMIQLTIVARTDKTDPDLAKVSDGFRRRTLMSNIQLRNLLFI
jgi:prepilin-type N-terminal cleavage/methylation domain-containing protein